MIRVFFTSAGLDPASGEVWNGAYDKNDAPGFFPALWISHEEPYLHLESQGDVDGVEWRFDLDLKMRPRIYTGAGRRE